MLKAETMIYLNFCPCVSLLLITLFLLNSVTLSHVIILFFSCHSYPFIDLNEFLMLLKFYVQPKEFVEIIYR